MGARMGIPWSAAPARTPSWWTISATASSRLTGGGRDLLRAEISIATLPDQVEDFRAQGDHGPIDGIGNNLKDLMKGNSSANSLSGAFDGVLQAGSAADRLVFNSGLETGSFAYRGDLAFDGLGNSQARFAGSGLLEIDTDGDSTADLAARIDGLSLAGQITSNDFL